MYQLLVLLTGVVLAVMISINGSLAGCFDQFSAAAIIHLVGTAAAFILCAARRERRPIIGHRPWWIYLGGIVGVLTTLFQNYAYLRISVTSLVALGLLGQTVASLFIDRFGFFGMERHPFRKSSLIGLAFAAAGIVSMLDASVSAALAAVLLSFAGGVCVVVSRTINSRLADRTGALLCSLTAHATGLIFTVALALIFAGETFFTPVAAGASRMWIYLGGILGVTVIVLCNVTVPRVSAFRLTLLTFVGQIFTGILLDVAMGRAYSDTTFTGGLIIAAGIGINIVIDRAADNRAKKKSE